MTAQEENSKQKGESMVDTSSPYFIHSSDHPGLVLVSKRLNGDNYAMWYRSMLIALTAKNKIGFVDGTIEPPSASKKPMDFALWVRCDKMVLSWLLNSVEPDLADGVVYAETSHEVWEDLRDRFSQGNAPRIFQIKKAITSHSQSSTSVSTYYTKLKSLWDELSSYQNPPTCSCGGMRVFNEQQDQDRIMQFLMGLNDTYSGILGHILVMNPLPTVRKAYSLIIQEEKQRELSNGVAENFSMAATTQSRLNNGHTEEFCRKLHGNNSFGSGGKRDSHKSTRGLDSRKGQRSNFSASGRDSTSSQPTALAAQSSFQDQSTHSNVSDQNILNGLTPDQFQQLAEAISMVKSRSSTHAHANAAGRSSLEIPSINSDLSQPWILDSEATDHITPHSSLFTKSQSSSLPIVNLPNGSAAPITSTGT
ncbi:hypothetical protein RHSIM_Rhsim02G0004200 [Rhododendron simsii]|uniref:Retrotransposon Copia-like N-terminal domain-containing protein n=1 Tax=Rhododendron simsii TaxID=118357 RepID=A0A834HFP5_RHOSS|nr:hypothetical protein RHSIM_Rhsim02G0004200 [Rhododendron simsii]